MSAACNQTNQNMKHEDIISRINDGVCTPDAACSILGALQKDLVVSADYQLLFTAESLLKQLIEVFHKDSHLKDLINVFVMQLKREPSLYYSMEDSENILYNIKVLKIIAQNYSDDNLVFEDLQEVNTTQLIKAMILNCKDGPTEIFFKFVHCKLLPEILKQNYNSNKKIIDLIFAMPIGFAYGYMNQEQIRDFKKEVINRYLPPLNQEDSLSSNWWIYCKLLIYYCGKILHSEKDMTNAILRLVEQGFKLRGTTDKLGCFECWKVLIESYYLDPRYLKGHLRLLLQPLKLKFGWNIEIFEARFDCYLSLLEKLENSSHVCIEEFLNAVFISFSDEDANNIKALMPGQALKDIFTKGTEVLLKLLGHDKETCCKNKDIYLTDIYKIKPYLTGTLLNGHAELFVSAVRICSEMTLFWSHEKSREILVNCLWSTLFNLIQYNGKEGKGRATLQVVKQNFQIISKKCLCNVRYYDLLRVILKSFTNFLDNGTIKTDDFIYKELLLDMVKDICRLQSHNQLPLATSQEILKNLLDCCKQEKSFMDDIQTNFLDKCDYAYCKPVVIYTARNISTILNHKDSALEKRKFVKNLLDWCLENDLHKFWESVLKNGSILAISDMKMDLVAVIKAAAQQNNALLPTVLKLCAMYLKILSRRDGLVFTGLIDVILVCYSKENLERNIKYDIAKTLKTVVEAKKQNDFEVNTNFYQCFENVLTIHKAYEVLVVLSDFMESVKTNKNFPKSLENIVNSFSLNSDMEYKKSAQKIMIKLENLNNKSIALTSMSRAAKITSLANENIQSNLLNLFAASHIKPNSPVRFKGLQVERDLTKYLSPKNRNEMSPKTKKIVPLSLNDLDEKDFVVIDKKVEIVADKLSEHQREMAKKRRDDIPALYQDLTQSSMDFLTNTDVVINSETVLDTDKVSKVDAENANDLEKKIKTETILIKNFEMLPKNKTNLLDEKPLPEDKIKIERIKISDIIRKPTSNSINNNESEDFQSGSKKRKQIFENIRKDEIEEDNKIKSEIELSDVSSSGSACTDTPNSTNTNSTETPRKRRGRKTNSERFELLRLSQEQAEKQKADEDSGPLTKAAQRALHHLRLDIVGAEEFRKELPKRLVKRKNNENFLTSSPRKRTEKLSLLDCGDNKQGDDSKQTKTRKKVKAELLTEAENHADNNDCLAESDTIVEDDSKELGRTDGTEIKINNCSDTETLLDESEISDRNSDTITQSCEDSKPLKVSDMDTESLSFTNSPNNVCDGLTQTNKISEMDTESLSITSDLVETDCVQELIPADGSPIRDKNNLQCSPVTNETPTRKKELLNNTSDISPIKIEVNTSLSTPQRKSPDIFSEEDDLRNMFEIEADLNGIKPRSEAEICLAEEKYKNSVRLNGGFPPKTAKCIEFPLVNLSSPKTNRIKKMMLNCEQNRIGSENKDEDDFININNNILQFDREVPSPFATPKASILKRTRDEFSPGLSPCPKRRKRVNFSDPPTTSEKIYFKEIEENSHFRKIKKKSLNNLINQKKNPIEPETSMALIEKTIETLPLPLNDTPNEISPQIDDPPNEISPQIDDPPNEISAQIDDPPNKMSPVTDDPPSSEAATESEYQTYDKRAVCHKCDTEEASKLKEINVDNITLAIGTLLKTVREIVPKERYGSIITKSVQIGGGYTPDTIEILLNVLTKTT